jgi:hypothetical protein
MASLTDVVRWYVCVQHRDATTTAIIAVAVFTSCHMCSAVAQ